MSREQRLEIGVVSGPHGVHGGLRVRLHDAASTALAPGKRLVFAAEGRADIELAVTSCAEVPGSGGTWRIELEGIRRREDADALRGRALVVPRDELPALGDDEFYLADAIGLPVRRRGEGDRVDELGKVRGLTGNGAQDLFEVAYRDRKGRTRTWLLPVLPTFVRDVTAEAVWIELPPGMLPDDLESPHDAERDAEPEAG
ncbi:MAG: 16S rRNA processing protein RimM [Deltaproteobacteria bacterium]|nr:16S rRNA processing protein RimM [Nannocystaceae bacterium]